MGRKGVCCCPCIDRVVRVDCRTLSIAESKARQGVESGESECLGNRARSFFRHGSSDRRYDIIIIGLVPINAASNRKSPEFRDVNGPSPGLN